jgi:hypothetical protein
LYRNGTKAGVIPRDKLSTKISGLALDTDYNFQLVLRTSAGQYASEKITVRTHKMTDLTGITITPGIMAPQLKDSLAETVNQIGAKMIDTVRIDTTHFVCTDPRGQAWEKAVEMNVPVVVPDWLKGCEREGRIVGVRGYYLDADPKLRQIGPTTSQQRGSVSSIVTHDGPRIEHTPPTPEQSRAGQRESNGAVEPPTPPPKPAGAISASTSTTSVNTTRAAAPSTGGGAKGLTQDESDQDSDADAEEEEDEDEDSDDAEMRAAAAKAKAERPKQNTKNDEGEDFDEVAL